MGGGEGSGGCLASSDLRGPPFPAPAPNVSDRWRAGRRSALQIENRPGGRLCFTNPRRLPHQVWLDAPTGGWRARRWPLCDATGKLGGSCVCAKHWELPALPSSPPLGPRPACPLPPAVLLEEPTCSPAAHAGRGVGVGLGRQRLGLPRSRVPPGCGLGSPHPQTRNQVVTCVHGWL